MKPAKRQTLVGMSTGTRKPVPPPPAPGVERLQAYVRGPAARLAALVLVLGSFTVHGVVAGRTNTPTPDEFAYVPEGYYHLRTGDLSFDTTNPPLLKMAMALPLLLMDVQLDIDPRWRDNRTGWGPWTFGKRFSASNALSAIDASKPFCESLWR